MKLPSVVTHEACSYGLTWDQVRLLHVLISISKETGNLPFKLPFQQDLVLMVGTSEPFRLNQP